MARLTKEREQEIRECSNSNSVDLLLSEIDALRAENTTLKLDRDCDLISNTKTFYRGGVLIERLGEVSAENKKLRAENEKLTFMYDSLGAGVDSQIGQLERATSELNKRAEENQKLRERVAKLREVLKRYVDISIPSASAGDYSTADCNPAAQTALAQDDEMEGKKS